MKIEIKYKNVYIQDVRVGDYVKSFDIETEKIRHNRVGNTILPIVEKYRQCKIVCENGSTVTTSTTHPMCYFDTVDNRWAYKNSGELVVGDMVKGEFDVTTIKELTIGCDEDEQFYDLTVERDNNYFAGDDQDNMVVVHNSATLYFPFWHQEIEDVLVLKNNKGTDDNRVRHIDYGIQFSRLFYKRFLENKELSLFSPHDVPGLYEAFGYNDKFDVLYEKYENDKNIPQKRIKARSLMSVFIQERIATGRIYVYNIDHANTNTPFVDKLVTSNLCLTGATLIHNVKIDGQIFNTYKLINLVNEYNNNEDKVFEVLSKNIETNELEYKKIVKAWKTKEDADIVKLSDGQIELKSTACHLIYTKNNGYIRVDEITEDDVLDLLSIFNSGKLIVESIDEKEDVYDLTIEDNHNFYANSILVHNCTETILPVNPINSIYDIDDRTETEHLSEGEIALCNLAGLNLGNIKTDEDLMKASEYTVRILDFTISHQDYPVNAAKKMIKRRSLGIGVINFAYWLAKQDLKYTDNEALPHVDELFEKIQYYLLLASNKLAKEFGKCEWYHKTTYAQGIMPMDRYNKNVDKLFNRELSCDWEQLKADMEIYGLRNSVVTLQFPAESCVTKDTEIILEDGTIKSYDEIFKEQNIDIDKIEQKGIADWFEFINPFYVKTKDGSDLCNKFYYNGKKEVYEITFEDGKTYKMTANHKLLVNRDNTEIWTRVDELKENDDIINILNDRF